MSIASDWIEKFTAPGVSVEVATVMIEDMKKEGKVSNLVNDWIRFPDHSILNIKTDLWDQKNSKNNL
jgi:hypothetical protein